MTCKQAKVISYGDRINGAARFDDASEFPIVTDPDTGEDYASVFMGGINTHMDPNSGRFGHVMSAFGPYLSEGISNSLVRDKKALKAYLVRYAKALEAYKAKHGRYPKQRLFGHSRGGATAFDFISALHQTHPELPKIDDVVLLDPYSLPSRKLKRIPGMADSAGNFTTIRPSYHGLFAEGITDENQDGIISRRERLRSRLTDILLRGVKRVDPPRGENSVTVEVPGAAHSSVVEFMKAYFAVRKRRLQERAAQLAQTETPQILKAAAFLDNI